MKKNTRLSKKFKYFQMKNNIIYYKKQVLHLNQIKKNGIIKKESLVIKFSYKRKNKKKTGSNRRRRRVFFNFIYFRIKLERLTTRLNKKEEQIKEHQARQEIDGLKRNQENLEKMKQHHNNYEKEMVKEN